MGSNMASASFRRKKSILLLNRGQRVAGPLAFHGLPVVAARDKLSILLVKGFLALLCRVLLIALCGLAVWRSVRIAAADWLASEGTTESFERALHFAPENPQLLARAAILRSDNGDPSPAVDEELRRAAAMNPFDSALPMTLGLREEFRGNSAGAESYLVRAAEIDHQFKPAWTLANYYYRTNQPDKSWPVIARILSLEPLGFDPTPVFELCWNQAAGSRKILSLIPGRGHRPVQYLEFLVNTQKTEAAFEVWPVALRSADPADPTDIATLTKFADFLVGADRMPQAVTVWNQIVDSGIVRSGQLEPAKGISIADPDFKFAPVTRAFGWRVADVPGVFVSGFSGSLRLEINGDEPQTFQVLSTFAPVVSGTRYRLLWKSDGSQLNSPRDPGFSFQIVQQPGEVVSQCSPLLSAGSSAGCEFVTPPGSAQEQGRVGKVRIDLLYSRAQGTTRVSGVLQLFNVHLEIAR
jgi:tetratricopeptide (TPR) repeat protein